MSENQKRLLQQALDMLEEQALHIEAPMLPAGEELLNRIRAAISQQVEPAPAQDEVQAVIRNLRCIAKTVLSSEALLAEPAPAQDEREAFEDWCNCDLSRTTPDGPYRYSPASTYWRAWQARAELANRATHPAQTEQQPIQVTAVAVMRDDGDGGLEPDWLLEGGTAELMAGMVLVVAEGDITGDDGHGEVYAAPIAQTAPQPEQSEELAWKVLQATTDALDRRAAPHAWISQAWNAGSEVITSRRPVAGGRDE